MKESDDMLFIDIYWPKYARLIGSSAHSVWLTLETPCIPSTTCAFLSQEYFVYQEVRDICLGCSVFTVSTCSSCVLPGDFKQEGRFMPCISSSCVFLFSCLFLQKIYLFSIVGSYNWRQPLEAVLLFTTIVSLHWDVQCYFHEVGQFPGLQIVLFYFCFSLSVALYMWKSLKCLTSGFNSADRHPGFQFSVERNVSGWKLALRWYCSLIKYC